MQTRRNATDIKILFNPIALRKTKIVYKFCFAECNRIKCICSIMINCEIYVTFFKI